MEEESPINFKALRAKFQEEGFLAHLKTTRPAVAEKPRLLQPFLGHCSSVVSGIATAVENRTPEIPRVLFRDGLRSSGGKRQISFPPHPEQTPPSSMLANGDGSGKHSLKERHRPLVLPAPPVIDQPAGSEHKLESASGKEVFAHAKIKKGLLLPFKSVKASKPPADDGEEPAYGGLPSRPSSAPGEFSSMEKRSTEERASLQSDQSTSEFPVSSPESAVSPPPPETCPRADSRLLSTLEKAKKKLSRRQIPIPPKPKDLCSPDYSYREKTFPLSPKNPERTCSDAIAPPPACLPHLACISARPFIKANSSARKPSFGTQLKTDRVDQLPVRTYEPYSPQGPIRKLLPELWMLGPVPVKPPRPPTVDLSAYHAVLVKASPGWCRTPNKENVPVLDAPDFPDFEASELETAEGEAVDVAALETEALDVIVGNPATAVCCETAEYEAPDSDLTVYDPAESNRTHLIKDLNLGSPHIIPLDPASFPEPINLADFPELPLSNRHSYSEEAALDAFPNSRSDDTDMGAVESPSVPEEAQPKATPTSNHETQTQPSEHHQDDYYDTCDNVYEDVEINKLLASQISAKQKNQFKNPYADSKSRKGETRLHKRPRNPWYSTISGEHSPLTHHIMKQHTSPNTADHKEQRKREKQRLEKERKEQKEREKKENEMKKKFKVTGEEEPMYHAKVTVASKVRKHDLPVRSGDTVSIIRTTNCPKGKWLARDANHKYGYISVMNVELNIKDMLELGKKAQAAGRGAYVEPDTISIGSRSSNPPLLTSSFTDDSEEWACEDETLSPSYESHIAQQTASEPETSGVHVDVQHTFGDSNPEELHTQTRHEALQNLAIFVQRCQEEREDGGVAPNSEQEIDFTELELLPPPPLYADSL